MDLSDIGMKVKNLKCFGNEAQGFEQIKPINVIIGRNNSGKSALIDLLDYATSGSDVRWRGRNGQFPEAIQSGLVRQEVLDCIEGVSTVFNGPHGPETLDVPKGAPQFLNAPYSGILGSDWLLAPVTLDGHGQTEKYRAAVEKLLQRRINCVLAKAPFLRLAAERDIVPEASGHMSIAQNGDGLTHVVRRVIHDESYDRNIVECEMLRELNRICSPDCEFHRILTEFVDHEDGELWQIHLQIFDGTQVPLAQMGSGIKTVILVLAKLFLDPYLREVKRLENPKADANHKTPLSDYVFAFEELENNLHPAMQRRLFTFLAEFVETNNCTMFITTHSSVVIDLFAHNDMAQLVHVSNENGESTVKTVSTMGHKHSILDDLDVRASDLLQTNVVVWVEGPSDRLYFNKWIELWAQGTIEHGVHYQCVFFGGSLNAHLSLKIEEDDEADLIEAIKVCRHAIILMDSDKRTADDSLKPHTERLADETDKSGGLSWITAGREVENYIPNDVAKQVKGQPIPNGEDEYYDACEFLRSTENEPKVALARRVLPLLTQEGLEKHLDLAAKLDQVVEKIEAWNK